MQNRRTWTTVGVIGLGVVLGVIAVLVLRPAGAGDDPPAAGTPSSGTPSGPLEDLGAIEAALNSGDPAVIRGVLTREAASGLDATVPVLPAGATVEVDDASFVQSGEETAYVSAEVAGPQPGRHLILLWRQDDAWRVVATAPEP